LNESIKNVIQTIKNHRWDYERRLGDESDRRDNMQRQLEGAVKNIEFYQGIIDACNRAVAALDSNLISD
jgi:hypothetical protein